MTGDDLIVAAPWVAFAAGLALIGWRLAASRGRRRHGPPRPGTSGRPSRDEAGDRPRRDPARPGDPAKTRPGRPARPGTGRRR